MQRADPILRRFAALTCASLAQASERGCSDIQSRRLQTPTERLRTERRTLDRISVADSEYQTRTESFVRACSCLAALLLFKRGELGGAFRWRRPLARSGAPHLRAEHSTILPCHFLTGDSYMIPQKRARMRLRRAITNIWISAPSRRRTFHELIYILSRIYACGLPRYGYNVPS